MKKAIEMGLSFGLTSGVITTLGLIIGLYFGTHSKLAIVGGILTIAVADSLSDATGIHVSAEADKKITKKDIWRSTLSTFWAKFIFALSFLIPVLIFGLKTAIIISIIYGLFLVAGLSYYISKKNGHKTSKVIKEHLIIVIVVIILTYLIGIFISQFFS